MDQTNRKKTKATLMFLCNRDSLPAIDAFAEEPLDVQGVKASLWLVNVLLSLYVAQGYLLGEEGKRNVFDR